MATCSNRQCTARRGERGSALLIVLWMSVLLSVTLLGVAALVQTQIRSAAFERDRMRQEEALFSALDIVAYDTALIGRTALSDLPRTLRIGDQTVTVSLAATQSMLDINMANDEDWITLFTRLGETRATARRLADQILDWRDPDTNRRDYGAEDADFAPDSPERPANRPFLSVDELGRVRDITQQRLACLQPYVTALGGTRLPELTDLAGAQAAPMDGLRVAFRAEVVEPQGRHDSLVGLALFAGGSQRPYEWVSFGDDRPEPGLCEAAQAGPGATG